MRELEPVWRRALAPPERTPTWRWADEHVVLGSRQPTAHKGRHRSALTPYLRGIYDALDDPRVESVAICKGAQTGATLLAHVCLLRWLSSDPAPALVVMPSEQIARSVSEHRFIPLLEDCDETSRLIPSSADGITKLGQNFPGMEIRWVGSNSPANLATRPARYLLLDEVDKYPVESRGEGAVTALAVQRSKSFWNRKVVFLSTPTTEDGEIWRRYQEGDRRKYHLRCPGCERWLVPEWSLVRWPEGNPGEAALVCPCGRPFTQQEYRRAVAVGEWRPTAVPAIPGHVSFHVPSWLAPWPACSFPSLARRWVAKQGVEPELRDIVNGEFGEPWKEKADVIPDSAIADRVGPYDRGSDPGSAIGDDRARTILTVDVQKDHLRWLARRWTAGGDSALLDWGICHEWGQVNDIANRPGHLKAAWVLVDAAYGERTQEVYEASLRYRMIPIAGKDSLKDLVWTQSTLNPYEGTRRQKEGHQLAAVWFRADPIKAVLSGLIQARVRSVRWLVYRGIESDYCEQLLSEHRVRGKWVERRTNAPNHCWDLEVYQLLGAMVVGMFRFLDRERPETDPATAQPPDAFTA